MTITGETVFSKSDFSDDNPFLSLASYSVFGDPKLKTIEITMLNNLKPYKTTWKVEVKVLHSWTQHSNYNGDDTFEFILEDKMGSEIHCTCKRVFLDRVKKL
ncbi:hypothetical protein YC2023_050624 [Brassica napus]